MVNTVIPRLQRQHLWLSRALVLCFSWPPPNLREAHEVITKVKSYCATETGARGGKKSWQKISGVSLERFRKWEETEQIGEKGLREELAEVEAEEGPKWRWRESAWNKEIQKRELSAQGVRVIAVEERESGGVDVRRWKTFSLAPGPAGVCVGPPRVSDLYSNPRDSCRCQHHARLSYSSPQTSVMCLWTQRPCCHNNHISDPHGLHILQLHAQKFLIF